MARSINFEAVRFTPAGGSAINITAVQSIDADESGQILTGRGDNNFYPVHMRAVTSDPSWTVTHEDKTAHQSLVYGNKGAFTYIIKDQDSIAGTLGAGDITVAISNAVLVKKSASRGHAGYGKHTFGVGAFSTDGQTSMIVYS